MFIVAEWAIARLQIEGARQEKPRLHHESSVDSEAKVATQQSNGLSTPELHATSKNPPVQDRSRTAIDRVDEVNSDATPTTDSPKVSVHGSYNCTSGKHSGNLLVTSTGVRFHSAVGSKDQWEMRYDNMHRVEKVRNSDSISHHLNDVLPLTAILLSTGQSHCQNRLWSRYPFYRWAWSGFCCSKCD